MDINTSEDYEETGDLSSTLSQDFSVITTDLESEWQ
jgi:hypothetical protein